MKIHGVYLGIIFLMVLFNFYLLQRKPSIKQCKIYKDVPHFDYRRELTFKKEEPEIELKSIQQNSIKFVIQSYSRESMGYYYLKNTVESIHQNFEQFPLKYEILVYSSTGNPRINGIKFQEIFKNVSMEELAKKKIDPKSTKYLKKASQTIDFYSLLQSLKNTCKKDEIFFFMEDDFIFCYNGILHWFLAKKWATENFDKWRTVRVSIGLNGLFLKCRDIPLYLSVIDQEFAKEPWNPIDNILGTYWSHYYNKNSPIVQYIYRYNLLHHIGEISSVGNQEERNNACLEMNSKSIYHWFEKFDYYLCKNYLFSPCHFNNTSLFQGYDNSISGIQEIPGSIDTIKSLMKDLGIEIKISKFLIYSCDQVCKSFNLKCNRFGFLIANSGNFLRREFFTLDHPIGVSKTDPLIHKIYGSIVLTQDIRRSTCHQSFEGYFRICPCSKF